MQHFNKDDFCWEEIDDYEPLDDSYKYISHEYIINADRKVGTALERCNLGFGDDVDKAEVKEFCRLLAEPLRQGLFQDCIIHNIFPMVKYV